MCFILFIQNLPLTTGLKHIAINVLKWHRIILNKTETEKLHREQVIKLLGKPDTDYGYQLGYFLSITTADFMKLSFRFDDQGRVLKAYIHQT